MVRTRLRIALGALMLLAGQHAHLFAQERTFGVHGRILDSGSGSPIRGAAVELGGIGAVLSDSAGQFHFAAVPRGRYSLTVRQLGYASQEIALLLRSDTTLTIGLRVEPVRLDPLQVGTRRITLRGEVHDVETRLGLIDVDVRAGTVTATTNHLGRFKINDVAAHQPLTVSLRGFGYHPMEQVITPGRDTTVRFLLKPDSLIIGMIAEQVQRIHQRSRGIRTTTLQPIERAELLRNINWTVLDIVRYRTVNRAGSFACVMIDERQSHVGLEEIATLLPDEVEYIEFIDIDPTSGRDKMLRIYTRKYMQKMVGSRQPLRRIVGFNPFGKALCR